MIPFDPTALPQLTTRKALLVLDFQNEFLSSEGALHVSQPDGFVARTIKVADAFRRSGSGEVIWVKSEYDKHRPVKGEQIIVADNPILPSHSSSSSSRRRPPPLPTDPLADHDPEAFLSRPDGPETDGEAAPKPVCVLPGSIGAEMPSKITATMSPKDFTLTKNDYSAFELPQLLKRLRTRFITELYICGALTNMSVYATALDAGRHGLALTLIEDCCGYRGVMRHTNAVRRLIQLTGCDTLIADDVIASIITPPAPPPSSRQRSRPSPPRKEVVQKPPVPAQKSAVPVAVTGVVAASASKATGDAAATAKLPLRPKSKDESQDSVVVARGEEVTPLAAKRSSPAAPEPADPEKQSFTSATSPAAITAPGTASSDKIEPDTDDEQPTSKLSVELEAQEKGKNPKQLELEPEKEKVKPQRLKSPPPNWIESSDVLEADPNPSHEGSGELPTLKFKRANQAGRSNQAPSDARERVLRATRQHKPSLSGPDGEWTILPMSPPHQGRGTEPNSLNAPLSPVKEPKEVPTLRPDADDDSESSSSAGDEHKQPTVSEKMCEGDTRIFYNVLSPTLEKGIFERLKDEVKWLRMAHQGGEVPRLVCIQGSVDSDGNMPVYRHPSDESPPLVPFTTTVTQIKDQVEKILGHPLNHVLIQLYRDGNDYISEHSDKTLDIVKGSFICNVSLGAERTMTFRTKRPDKDPSRIVTPDSSAAPAGVPKRTTARARLPHNSLCRMGLATNMRWLHSIRQDKRREQEKDAAELAFAGGRISLTFRHIGTYLNRDSTLIWGQGAVSKTLEDARPVVNGQTPEAIKMLQAFGTENHSSDFDWEKHYGEGFDVLHMSNAPRFFSSADGVVNMRVQLMLAEAGIGYAKGSMGDAAASVEGVPIRFVDNDPGKSVVEGDVAIMLYLDGVRSRTRDKAVAPTDLARRYTRFQQALALLRRWRTVLAQAKKADDDSDEDSEDKDRCRRSLDLLRALKRELTMWNGYAAETADDGFIAGGEAPSVADFALWPALYDMQEACGGDEAFAASLRALGCKDLLAYYLILATRSCVKRVLKGAVEQ